MRNGYIYDNVHEKQFRIVQINDDSTVEVLEESPVYKTFNEVSDAIYKSVLKYDQKYNFGDWENLEVDLEIQTREPNGEWEYYDSCLDYFMNI